MNGLTLQLLGGFKASIEGLETLTLSSRKGRALLVWLAMNQDRRKDRDAAVGLLWGDGPQKQAGASLNQTVYELRQSFGPRGREVLKTHRDAIELVTEATKVDALAFSRLARSRDMADIEMAERLYRGDLLAGFVAPTPEFEDWMETERRRLRAEAIQVLTKLIAWYAEQGRSAQAAAAAERLIGFDPYSEMAHRALMIDFAVKGQLGLSNDVYERLRRRLQKDLNVVPSNETEQLRIKILKRDLELSGDAQAPRKTAASPQRSPSARRPRSLRRIGLLLAIVATLAAGAASWWWMIPKLGSVDQEAAALPLPAKPSIAVLPFDDLSTGPNRNYLSDAISEGIITELSRFPELFVIARNSSFHYRNTATEAREIARELGVRYILEGSRQKAGDRLRVVVQLIDAVGGNHLWAESYDRDLEDIFRVQDEITRTVVSTLAKKLVVVASNEATRADPESLNAFGFWLKGMKHWREFTRDGNQRALQAFLKALDANPDLARGHIGLAFVYVNGFRWGWTNLDREEALVRAREASQRALELAPKDYLSHMSMAYVLMHAGEHDSAIIRFWEALALNPNATDVMVTLAETLGYIGRGEEAIGLLEEAMRRDPHHPDWVKWTLGWIQYIVGRCDDALVTMQRMSSLPILANRTLATSYVCLGRPDEARAAIAKILASEPGYSISDVRVSMHDKLKIEADLEHWLSDLRKAGLPE